MTGSATEGIKTVLHPVSDLATAKPVYAALLGVPPQTDESYYASFEAEVTAAGATVKEPAHNVGGGRLVATVTDPDGNVLGLVQDR
jgi:predicted enzyme related to lactoylglutathione lyase